MPEEKVCLDVTEIENFRYDMNRCVRCKGCKWVDHIYMSGVKFGSRCPSEKSGLFDSFGAFGKLRLALGIMDGALEYSDRFLEAIYKCQLCGACDVGCKRNLDLEILLVLEALRIKCVQDGAGPLPAHKKVAENTSKTHCSFGATPDGRLKWLPKDIQVSEKADMVYFVGCDSSFRHPEIAQSTVKILQSAGQNFMLFGTEEWCCGNIQYSAGMIDEAREIVQHNIEAVKNSGANTILVSCAECYRMWKVDYPKILGKSTEDMGFEVIHLVELVDDLVKNEALKLTNPINMRIAYHDSCSLSRLSEPWVQWEGTRGLWGVTNPSLARRRGTNGVYQQPRDILEAIPGIELVEMIRMKENAWCCGAGRGTKEAFADFALWTADERLEEVREIGAEAIVSTCPHCKGNFYGAIGAKGDKIKVYDIAELISEAISK